MPSLAIRPPVPGGTRPSSAGHRGVKLLGNSRFCDFFFPVGGIRANVHVSFHQETPMAELQDALPQPVRRDRSVEARREARLKKDTRERRIIGMLDLGVSMAEIAAREGVTLRRMQIVVKDILVRRAPPAPSEYLALQVSRLNEAMMVAYGSMAGGNLTAVDRVVRLVKEMDRYHGFFPSGDAGAAAPDRLAPPAKAPLALAAPTAMEMTPQTFEKARFGDGNGERPWRDHKAAPAGGCDGNGAANI